jgi:hypothetical protein
MNSIFKYGIISGLVLVVFTWAGDLIFGLKPENFEIQEVYGYASMVLGLSVIFFGVRRYRDELEGGNISFGKALTIGVLTDLVTSIIYGVYMMIYLRWISPDFLQTYAEFYRDKVANSGLPAAEIASQLAELDANMGLYLDANFNSFLMFATVFLIGAVVALASAAILRRS